MAASASGRPGLAGGRGCRCRRSALGLGRLAGGGDVVARVGVEAGGLAGGWLVGAGGALGGIWADWPVGGRSGPSGWHSFLGWSRRSEAW